MSTIENGKYKGIDSSKREEIINQGGTILGAPILIKDDNTFAVNATEINWKGYNLDDNFTYTGDLISYITSSYSYVLDELSKKASESDIVWDRDIYTKSPIILYKLSNRTDNEVEPFVNQTNSTNTTYFNSSQNNGQGWSLNKDGTGDYVWISSYYAVALNGSFSYWDGPSSTPTILKGNNSPYFEQRWCIYDIGETPNTPGDNDLTIGQDGTLWKLTPQYSSTKVTWMTSRKVIYNANDVASWATNSHWSTPMKVTGTDGVSQPIQPVLKYQWCSTNDYNNAPSIDEDENNNPSSSWTESPNNPTSPNIYLWMIQGKRQNGVYIEISSGKYWSDPVCLSGADGTPGADGDDIEFIYKLCEDATEFTGENNPKNWYSNSDITNAAVPYNEQGDNNSVVYMNDYLGKIEFGWTDHPQGVSLVNKYEYAAYRKTQKRNGVAYWEAFSDPFCWSVFGENGLDGDGVEYIYRTTTSSSSITEPQQITYSEINSAQSQYEWGIGTNNWVDDPQTLDNTTNKYQWVSTRKYTTIRNDNSIYSYQYLTSSKSKPSSSGSSSSSSGNGQQISPGIDIGGIDTPSSQFGGPRSYIIHDENDICYVCYCSTAHMLVEYGEDPEPEEWFTDPLQNPDGSYVRIGQKAWFPYSKPQLWNWYVKDGTNADNIAIVYKRNNNNNSITKPTRKVQSGKYKTIIYTYQDASQSGWASSPGNADISTYGNAYAYLWMSSVHYSAVTEGNNLVQYTLSEQWSDPVCLTGEPGHDGEDGTDIEFIYYRTTDENAPSIPEYSINDVDYQETDWPCNVTTVDGVSYYDPNNQYGENTYSYMLHDVWTDNPIGITHDYDYEYAAIRKKINKQWQAFSPVFVWSKYGEDGVDGDGVEYIFYLSSNELAVTFDDPESLSVNNNPVTWPPSQDPEYIHNNYKYNPQNPSYNIWSDDPRGVSPEHSWEYVSVRHKRLNSSTGDVEWGKYSNPVLWSKYAFDAVASNLTFETDNDMMAVAIDGNNKTRTASTNIANFYLYHNIQPVDNSKYTVEFTSYNYSNATLSNTNDYIEDEDNNIIAQIAQDNNTNQWRVTVTIPEDVDLPEDGAFTFTIKATVSNDNNLPAEIISQEKFYTIKVLGLSLSTIYQLRTDTVVLKRDVQNSLSPTKIHPTMFNISDINDVFTTDSGSNPLPPGFFVFAKLKYNNGTDDNTRYGSNPCFSKTGNSIIGNPVGECKLSYYEGYANDTNNTNLAAIEFNLIYTTNNTDLSIINYYLTNHSPLGDISNATLVDRETVSVVADGLQGNPGVDSKSQEYIYMLTNDINFFDNSSALNNYYKPQNWENLNYSGFNTDDYPFISTNNPQDIDGIKYVTSIHTTGSSTVLANKSQYNSSIDAYSGVWTDNPQGVSNEYKYEWWSMRSYDTSSESWQSFSKPVIRANWGHEGEDGDGVEYIYCTEEINLTYTNTKNPAQWIYIYRSDTQGGPLNYNDFQVSEYIPDINGSGTEGNGHNWTDNPTPISATNNTEYISIRKYKIYNVDDFIRDLTGVKYKTWDFTNRQQSSNTYEITDNEEILEGLFNHLLTLSYDSCGLVELFDNIVEYCLNNNLTDSNIYNASNVVDYKTDGDPSSARVCKVSNTWFYNIILFVAKSKDKINNNQKCWNPYSIPKLWANYGESGPEGKKPPTLDFTNDQINLAVLEDKKVNNNANQSKFSDLIVYNDTFVKNTDNLTITVDSENSGKIAIYKSTSSVTQSQISALSHKIVITAVNDSINDSKINVGVYIKTNCDSNIIIPENGIEVIFTATTTSGEILSKVLKICGQHIPTNGKNTITYEIVPSVNSIKIEGGNKIPNTLSYNVYKYDGDNILNITNNWESNLSTCWDPYDGATIINSNQYSVSHLGSGCSYLNLELKYNNDVIDRESIPIVSDGETGPAGADAIVLDFTNDQINFAVNNSRYLIGSQTKTTTLNIINKGDYSVEISVSSPYITTSNNSEKIKYSQTANTGSSFTYSFVVNDDNGHNLQIPENGIEVTFEVTLTQTGKPNITLNKVLKICSQHNGENAVTYELNPTYSSIVKKASGSFSPTNISVGVTKFDGTTITSLAYNGTNKFSDNFLVSYKIGTSSAKIYSGPIYCSSANNGSAINNNITLQLHNGLTTGSTVIDRETIPLIYDGEIGLQGFTGPIVRMCGMFTNNSLSRKFGDGTFNTLSEGPQYDGTSPLYKDIVAYTSNIGTKYYTPNHNRSSKTYISDTNDTYLCQGSSYIINIWPSNSGGTTNAGWIQANQFDFVATKLLYADQGLINQLSSHDFITTTEDGIPVAGMTSGKKDYGNNPESLTLLNNANGGVITNSGSSDSPTTGNDYYGDKSHVRIFAGQIWNDDNSYSLTYAPFNVRQDGTAYISKAVVEGDITADTLTLGTGSFSVFDSITINQVINVPNIIGKVKLPTLSGNKVQVFYIYTGNINIPYTTETSSDSYQKGVWKNESETWNHPTQHEYKYYYNRITPAKNTLLQFIGLNETWNIVETKLISNAVINPIYYDVTSDLDLILKSWDDNAWYNTKLVNASQKELAPMLSYTNDGKVVIDFYTYLHQNPAIDNYDYAFADFNRLFGWVMGEITN